MRYLIVGGIICILLTATSLSNDSKKGKQVMTFYSDKELNEQGGIFLKEHGLDPEVSKWDCSPPDGYPIKMFTLLGINCYEITSRSLLTGDWMVERAPTSLLLYVGKDGKAVRLNHGPSCLADCQFQIKRSDIAISAILDFLKQAGVPLRELSKRTIAEVFLYSACHFHPGEFPRVILTSEESKKVCDEEQKKYQKEISNINDEYVYQVIAEFPHLKETAKLTFFFGKKNEIKSVSFLTLK